MSVAVLKVKSEILRELATSGVSGVASVSSYARYLWDGVQLVGEIHARGDLGASDAEMEDDAPVRRVVVTSRCIDVTVWTYPRTAR